MSRLDQVREHMQVIDAEGTPLGKVDRIEGDRIKLTRESSGGGAHEGHHHFIPAGLVADVEGDRRGREHFRNRGRRRRALAALLHGGFELAAGVSIADAPIEVRALGKG